VKKDPAVQRDSSADIVESAGHGELSIKEEYALQLLDLLSK